VAEREPLSTVISAGDVRASLVAIRDRLADEIDDIRWSKHKRECRCVCDMADLRALVAVAKELRAVIAAIDALPGSAEVSDLDQLADRRARRLAEAAGT
jgi:hypothetical protein